MTASRPLQGVRVVDLSRVLAGPFCTMILADLGAEVIKIESPRGGDETRHWGPPFFEGQSAYFLSVNRNKKSLALDLNVAGDQQRLHQLLAEADVLVENFVPGHLERWGLDPSTLEKRYPKLVVASLSGFGQEGPYARRPGYDAVIQAMTGLMSITGSDAEHPTKVGVAVSDVFTGLHGVIAILAALHERQRSGLGQRCELALMDVQIASLVNVVMNFLVSQKCPTPLGNAHPSIVPYETFPAADGLLMLAVGNDRQFQSLCEVFGKDWHTDKRFTTNPARVENRVELKKLLDTVFPQRTRAAWQELLDAKGIPSGPVLTLSEVHQDPHVQERGIFTTMDDGKTPCVASPFRFSRSARPEYKTPPKLGCDGDACFGEED